jgi:hypothetical protein
MGQPTEAASAKRASSAFVGFYPNGTAVTRMIYFVMPVGSDPNFADKRSILRRVLDGTKELGHFPLESGDGSPFDMERALFDMSMARIIVCDLALERPSCYFETGLAQAAHIPVRLIAPAGTAVHQVAGRDRVRYYADLSGYEDLIRKIVSTPSD